MDESVKNYTLVRQTDLAAGQCKLSGCIHLARQAARVVATGLKQRRWAKAFCRAHAGLRRKMSKDDFGKLRRDASLVVEWRKSPE